MDDISRAILFLQNNGYVVFKMTKEMIKDSDECEEMSVGGDCDKDCSECSCNRCVVQL